MVSGQTLHAELSGPRIFTRVTICLHQSSFATTLARSPSLFLDLSLGVKILLNFSKLLVR